VRHAARCATLLTMMIIVVSCVLGAGTPPHFDHVVIAIEENKDASQVIAAPYIASLAAQGASFTEMYALTHPSQPNYIGLFSGSMYGVTDNAVHDLNKPNLATSLITRGLSYLSYAEDLPVATPRIATSGLYARKHNPAASFTNLSTAVLLPFTSFPTDYATLPTVSYVIPNLANDMHNGLGIAAQVAAGDTWLSTHLDGYVQWAKTHNSLFILTFDEPLPTSSVGQTPIATIFVGAHVRTLALGGHLTLYSILRMLEDMYDMPYLAEEASAPPIPAEIWSD
jgi:phosphatidylinositol-3-phosphatase